AQWLEDGTSERWGQGGPSDHGASKTTLVMADAAASSDAVVHARATHNRGAHDGGDHEEARGAAPEPPGDANVVAIGTAAPLVLWVVALSSFVLAVGALLAALSSRRAADRL